MAQGDQATRPMNFQVPEEMRTMAERSVTQARQALESYLHAARRTSENMELPSTALKSVTDAFGGMGESQACLSSAAGEYDLVSGQASGEPRAGAHGEGRGRRQGRASRFCGCEALSRFLSS